MRVLGAGLLGEGVGGRQGRRRARRVWMAGGEIGESIFGGFGMVRWRIGRMNMGEREVLYIQGNSRPICCQF